MGQVSLFLLVLVIEIPVDFIIAEISGNLETEVKTSGKQQKLICKASLCLD